ncbi:hypothetical protein R1sor_004206 [Riccia sorocarpa]|uniref:Endonuclease/exonuclease/phosphatase domain-containing protein n=1 Tax=Riccia sorocarpa TaxID=122646 RepID=A0ABD3H7R5_9MARC
MTDNAFKVIAWNTRGFGRCLRRKVIRKFLKENQGAIIALQELKVTNRERLLLSLKAIVPGATIIVDYTVSGRGGAALIVPPTFTVIDSGRNELVDAYLCAVTTNGGNFTRYAFCGNRYDQARLDRFYLTGGGQWTHLVQSVTHHTDQVVSDHVPISLHCQLTTDTSKTYHKMDCNLLKKPGVLDKVKLAWVDHPPDAGNPQRKWQLAWLRVKKLLKHEAAIHKQHDKDLSDQMVELTRIREMNPLEVTAEHSARLQDLQSQIRNREQNDARAWRLRSKDRWLREGKAPSLYFFAQMRARFTRETMDAHAHTR